MGLEEGMDGYEQTYAIWKERIGNLAREDYNTLYNYAGKGWVTQNTSVEAINRLLNNGFNSSNYYTQAKTYLQYAGMNKDEVTNSVLDFYQQHVNTGDINTIGKEEIME